MKHFLILTTIFFMTSISISASEKLDLKDIVSGKYNAKTISGIDPIKGTDQYAQISDDDKQVVRYSFKTGRKTAVLFDLNATEGEHIDGFDGYLLSPDGQKMLISTKMERIYRRSYKAEFYVYTIANKRLGRLSDGGMEQVPTWSPDGKRVAFVRENNIFLVDLQADRKEIQITHDGKFNEIINGIPDWVNEEEFGFSRALAFNADGTALCWIRYDESKVKTYSLQLFKGLKPERTEYEDYPGTYSYKYPKAGQDNSQVTVWSYEIATGKIRQLAVPLDTDGYIPRLKATADARQMVVYTMNRHQDRLCLYGVDPITTQYKLLIEEKADKYVKEEAMENITIGKKTILVPSDRDGYMHLYLYDREGRLLRQVERGDYDVTDVYGYDERTGDVYYQAAALNPSDRQVYVAHKNGVVERLTTQEGWNTAMFSGDYQYFVNTWSDYDTPYIYTLYTNKGKQVKTLLDNEELKKSLAAYAFQPKETFTFTTSEGVLLDGWMIKPSDFDPNKPYPVIMHQYSGPGSQQVVNSWRAGSMGQGGLFDYYLAQKGFIIVTVDGRGTGGRGADFEKCTYLRLGDLESKDQVETAIYLGTLPYVDKDRIGIWGWSFGGFNTLMSMSEGRGVFKAGVAIAPPTHWKFYDTIYTERYMRTPQENPDGYAVNPIERVDKLHGALLLCHGMADDNVHPQNSFEYSEALVQAEKDFKELYYTNRNHGILGGNTRLHLLRQVADFFVKELKK